jgi:hypothetical protein
VIGLKSLIELVGIDIHPGRHLWWIIHHLYGVKNGTLIIANPNAACQQYSITHDVLPCHRDEMHKEFKKKML